MNLLVRGQKVDLTRSNPMLTNLKIELSWAVAPNSQSFDLDVSALLLDTSGQLVNQQNLVYYNNLTGGQGAVCLTKDNGTGLGSGNGEQIFINVRAVPSNITKIVIAISIHDAQIKRQSFGQVMNSYARIVNDQTGQELFCYDLGQEFTFETGLVVGEVYRHNGEWKFSAIGRGIDGGLSGLCSHFGLQTEPSLFVKSTISNSNNTNKVNNSNSSTPPSSINLSKIELKKSGDKINLNKTSQPLGEILVNLNWNQKVRQSNGGGFFSSIFGSESSVDLDLGCLFELEDGYKGVVQALGNSFGDLQHEPYIHLDHDDRTGASVSGENLRINGNRVVKFKRILVFAFIYEGVANWSQVDGVVTLKQQNGPDIVVRLDEHRNGKGMCAIALLENVNNQTMSVKKVVEYFNGHKEMDRAFSWGMRWTAGSK